MKRILYFFVIILLSAGSLDAQSFIGGSFSFSTEGGSTKTGNVETDKQTSTSVSFQPKAGYFFSDNFMAGAGLRLSTSSQKFTGEGDMVQKNSGFGITPFARYYAVEFGDFAIYGQGQLGVLFGSSKTESNGTSVDGPKTTNISFSVFPGVAYNISDLVSLEARINGFNIGISHEREKDEFAGTEVIDKTTNIGFGVNTNNIFTTGAITVGAIFKF